MRSTISAIRGRGTLAVVVQVEVPTKISERAKELLAELEHELQGGAKPGATTAADESGTNQTSAADSSERAVG